MNFYNPPVIARYLFKNAVFSNDENKILLTFDDAPSFANTEKILKKLNREQVKAAFFITGKASENNLPLLQEIISEGHLLGNHSYSHENLFFASPEKIYSEINGLNKFIEDKLSYPLKVFRPPYGRFNRKVIKTCNSLNMKMILWSLLAYDYKNDLNIVKFAFWKKLNSNSIVVLHDNGKTSKIIKDVLDAFFDIISLRGMQTGDPAKWLK